MGKHSARLYNSQPSDESIVRLWQQQSPEASEALSAKYNQYAIKTAYSILQNREDAEDAVSLAWLNVWRRNSLPAEPSALKHYVAKVVFRQHQRTALQLPLQRR